MIVPVFLLAKQVLIDHFGWIKIDYINLMITEITCSYFDYIQGNGTKVNFALNVNTL